jgi:hypothetical protein
MTLDRRLLEAWNRVFFSPEPAVNLAAARILFSLHALWVLLSRELPAISGLPAEFWAQVPRAELLRFLIFPGHPQVEHALMAAAVAALAGAALGILPRLCCLASALLLYHLAPLETIFWTASPYQRGFSVDVLALFTLSLAPCGDALALGGRAVREDSPAYCWPLRLVQLYLAQTYFFSGYAKLYRVGPEWLDPDNLRSWFLLFSQQDQVIRTGPLFGATGMWIADNWVLCLAAATYGVIVNLLFLATVVSRRSRWFFVPDALFFHIMVFFALSIFWINTPQLLVFVNWSWVAERVRTRMSPGA